MQTVSESSILQANSQKICYVEWIYYLKLQWKIPKISIFSKQFVCMEGCNMYFSSKVN